MSAISIELTPGALPNDGDLITNSVLRAIARPSVSLSGSFSTSSIADGAVTTAKLHDGALSADATGRGKMEDGFVTADKLAANSVTTAKIVDAAITSSKLAASIDFTGHTVILPPGFTSAEFSIVNGIVADTAHSLGAVPSSVRWVLVNKTTDLDYAVGDEVAAESFMESSTGSPVFSSGGNSTKVFLIAIDTGNIATYNKLTGNFETITNARWKAKCYAR